MNYYNSDYCTK